MPTMLFELADEPCCGLVASFLHRHDTFCASSRQASDIKMHCPVARLGLSSVPDCGPLCARLPVVQPYERRTLAQQIAHGLMCL